MTARPYNPMFKTADDAISAIRQNASELERLFDLSPQPWKAIRACCTAITNATNEIERRNNASEREAE